ncbi:MBL fold metallo-hydrolase [Sedimenticola selenatireducens]|uniref:MBL fold metallo-hydrolase n=1 Tax=Sedimenticola selenatireducens TaxID=191960 RepID=UPI0004AE6137|nr:MBL fold metallo-hydrolase [Sedimenticola selenatireducens]
MQRFIALFLTLLLPALSVAGDSLPSPQQVSDRTWAWIGPYGPPTRENGGFRMNLGFVVGDKAVAVIDSGYGEAMAEAMLTRIRAITDRPIKYVINTNSQPHRIMGNSAYRRAGAEVIAAAEAVPRITSEGPQFAATVAELLGLPSGSVAPPEAPDRILEQETFLDLGGVGLRLIPVGQAHTAGSLIAVVESDRVVFAGDVLYGGRLLAVLSQSRVAGWIEAYERLREFGDFRFVPGHGNPGILANFKQPTYKYLTTLKQYMDQAVDEGVDLQDAIGSLDQSPWKDLADFDALAGRNAHQAYLQSEAAAFE